MTDKGMITIRAILLDKLMINPMSDKNELCENSAIRFMIAAGTAKIKPIAIDIKPKNKNLQNTSHQYPVT